MTKFYGEVGYVETVEDSPGVWIEKVVEPKRFYYGDVIQNSRRLEATDNVNDNINVNNSISILADEYAYEHMFNIRYVEWMGAKWKVTNVQPQRPRLTLYIGGLYNEEQARIA